MSYTNVKLDNELDAALLKMVERDKTNKNAFIRNLILNAARASGIIAGNRENTAGVEKVLVYGAHARTEGGYGQPCTEGGFDQPSVEGGPANLRI